MLKVKLNTHEYIATKDHYEDGRLNVILLNKSRDEMINLTVSLPHSFLLTDIFVPNDNHESSFLNHIDGFDYYDIYDQLLDQDIILNKNIGEGNSGFNTYKGVLFNEEKIQMMEPFEQNFFNIE